ncbi:MAG: hypothetical protein WCE38_07995 [Burkholderiales bacterium]
MITYLYWGAVIALVIASMAIFAGKLNNIRTALVSSAVVLIVGWLAYYFHFEQLFVKRYGGVMSISVPAGQHHIAVTWKDDNLWVENYDPATNTCIFSEYSRGNLLQGKVVLKDCNPLMPTQAATPSDPTAK